MEDLHRDAAVAQEPGVRLAAQRFLLRSRARLDELAPAREEVAEGLLGRAMEGEPELVEVNTDEYDGIDLQRLLVERAYAPEARHVTRHLEPGPALQPNQGPDDILGGERRAVGKTDAGTELEDPRQGIRGAPSDGERGMGREIGVCGGERFEDVRKQREVTEPVPRPRFEGIEAVRNRDRVRLPLGNGPGART